MSHPLPLRLAGHAAIGALQAAMLAGTALAQPVPARAVQMFEEPPPLEMLRSIMVPESRPGGLTRRIVITSSPPPAARAPAVPASVTLPAPVEEAAPGQTRRIIITSPAPAATLSPAVPASVTLPDPVEEAAPAPQRPRRPAPRPVVLPAPQVTAEAPAPAAPVATAMPAPAPVAVTPAPVAEAGTIGFRINFALNSDVVPANAFPFVDRVGELMREQPHVKMQIEGHTDATGPYAYNQDLSLRRARSVAIHLVERQGIAPARIMILGRGPDAPLTDNPYDALNRRVQFARVE